MYEIYVVNSDDVLDDILDRCDTTFEELQKINGLKEEYQVASGDMLIVPVRDYKPISYYTVKSGDSVYEIAKNKGLDYQLILQLNGLDEGDYIYPNQTLILPKKEYLFYMTKENDTLEDVLRRSKIDINDLLKMNDKIYLQEGQFIVYPKK